jgi:urease accessory protein
MAWTGRLDLRYWRKAALGDADADVQSHPRTLTHDRHDGPLRVLAPLYPEGPAVCHHTLVHPPSGIVGGDDLTLNLSVEAGAHAFITTPGATRFYASQGDAAAQRCHLRLAADARLEWLPMEAIAYPACQASNVVHLALAPGAQMIGWDVLALGLPASGQPFAGGRHGRFEQCIDWQQTAAGSTAPRRVWLERGVIDTAASEYARFAVSPLGLNGCEALGVMWFASGSPLPAALRGALQDTARASSPTLSVTSPHPQLVLARSLAASAEPVLDAFKAVWAAWRHAAWALPATTPRIWRL